MNYAIYSSKKSGRLFKFLSQASTDVKSEIKVIICEYDIDKEILKLIEENNIAVRIFDYTTLPGSNNKEKNLELSNLMLSVLKEMNIDYMISIGSHLLSGDLLKEYEYRLINFHPALLPMYPGHKAIDQAINHGNTLLVGNTAHFIDSGMDTGKIIMQSVIPLQSFFDNGNDYDAILDLVIPMLNQLIFLLDNGRITVTDGKVRILGADYNKGMIFPFIQ